MQRRGYNGFSYADVAKELKITTASLHYHFSGKAILGKALIDRYASRFTERLVEIDERLSDPRDRLREYSRLYADVLRQHRLCLCGMLAAEYQTLPKTMRDAVLRFFEDNEVWLTRVLEQGLQQGTLHFNGTPRDEARVIVSGLEGAMLVTRPFGDVSRFESAASQLLASLSSVAPPK